MWLLLVMLLLLQERWDWLEEQRGYRNSYHVAEALLSSRIRVNIHTRLLVSTTSVPAATGVTAKVINKSIITAFTPPNITTARMEHLRLYLEANSATMNQVNVVTLMHRCGRYKQPLFSFLTRQQLLELLASERLSAQGIANTLYSIHQFKDDSKEIHRSTKEADLIEEILNIVSKHLESSVEVFDSQAISNALYGIRGIRTGADADADGGADLRPLLTILSQLKVKIDHSTELSGKYSMSAKGIGNALLGLQSLSADDTPIVAQLISRFTKYVQQCYEPLDGQAIASIMIGLRSSTADCREVNELIEAVNENIRKQRHRSGKKLILKSKEISMILCGMQSMKSSHTSVQVLMNTTLSIARKYRIWLQNGDEVTAAMTGLQYMGSHDASSRAIIKYITESLQRLRQNHHHRQRGAHNQKHVNNATHNDNNYNRQKNQKGVPNPIECYLEQRQIATCIYAMQSMTMEKEEPRMLLQVLTRAFNYELRRGKEIIDESNVARIVYGLQSMTCSSVGARDRPVRAILQIILSNLDKNITKSFSGQHITMISYGLKCMTSNTKEVRGLLGVLRAVLIHPDSSSTEVQNSYHQITNQNFASILYGLQGMHSVEPSVRSYLRALLPRVACVDGGDKGQRHMNGQEVGMACFGLRLLSNYWPAVQSCVSMIAYRIDAARVTGQLVMEGKEISMALNGMQSMRGRGMRNRTNSVSNHKDSSNNEVSVQGNGFEIVEGLGIVSTQPKWVVLDKEEGTWVPVSAAAVESDMMNNDKLLRRDARRSLDENNFDDKAISCVKTLLNSLYQVMKLRKSSLSFDQAASALYGFRGMSVEGLEGVEVELILQILLDDIKAAMIQISSENTMSTTSTSIDSRSVSAAFFGLQGMTCKGKVVEELLIQLAYAIELVPVINGQLVGNVLLGMQKMDSESSLGVKMVLRSLTSQIERCKDGIYMTGQNFGNALYGMKSMNSNIEEVRKMLLCIGNLLKESNAEMNGQNLGNALYGMQGMNENQGEVKLVLSALAHKMMTTTSKLSGLDVGMSLYGLRSMAGNSSNSPEVTVLLGLLIHKIKIDPTLTLKLGELSLAIIGVLRTCPWIRDDFLASLASKTKGMEYITGSVSTDSIVVNTN